MVDNRVQGTSSLRGTDQHEEQRSATHSQRKGGCSRRGVCFVEHIIRMAPQGLSWKLPRKCVVCTSTVTVYCCEYSSVLHKHHELSFSDRVTPRALLETVYVFAAYAPDVLVRVRVLHWMSQTSTASAPSAQVSQGEHPYGVGE